jgi:hypothetical protein
MSPVRMRRNIQPLCDKHNQMMTPVYLIWGTGNDTFSIPAFACEVRGCMRHFTITQGYHTISKGRVEKASKLFVLCSWDGLPMYLDEFEAQGSKRTWRCAQFGCKGEKTTNGPIQGDLKRTQKA